MTSRVNGAKHRLKIEYTNHSGKQDQAPKQKLKREDKKVFMLAGFFFKDLREKNEVISKLGDMGCEYIDEDRWNDSCTHVIAKRYIMSEKIMAALVAGRWVVNVDFVKLSHRIGAWVDPLPHIASENVLNHRQASVRNY